MVSRGCRVSDRPEHGFCVLFDTAAVAQPSEQQANPGGRQIPDVIFGKVTSIIGGGGYIKFQIG